MSDAVILFFFRGASAGVSGFPFPIARFLGEVKLGNTSENLVFGPVKQRNDHVTPATGVALTVTLSKQSGAFNPPQGAVTEVPALPDRQGGTFEIAANQHDADTLGMLWIYATSPSTDPFIGYYMVI